jgi:hypothetical protein
MVYDKIRFCLNIKKATMYNACWCNEIKYVDKLFSHIFVDSETIFMRLPICYYCHTNFLSQCNILKNCLYILCIMRN